MTDRIHSLTVVLERDIREDAAVDLIEAIKQLRGVLEVTSSVSDINSYMAETRAKFEIEQKLYRAIHDQS